MFFRRHKTESESTADANDTTLEKEQDSAPKYTTYPESVGSRHSDASANSDASNYCYDNEKHSLDQKNDALDEVKEDDNGKLAVEYPPSIFADTNEAWLFVFVTALAACTSTVTIPIYFPALDLLADKFSVPVSRINVTATVYSIFQGVSPIFWATLSDGWGRRPVYFCCILIYLAANVAIACTNTYSGLLGLRILQAFGGASTVSLIGGTIGDFSTRKTRGALVGVSTGVSLLGNCFGPLIGGGLQKQFDSWRAIFWGLVVFAGIVFVVVFFLLPETNRHLVGNGSREPPRKIWFLMSWSPYTIYRRHLTGLPKKPSDPTYNDEWILPGNKIKWFRWLELLLEPKVLLLLFATAMHYTTWYMVLTAQSTVLSAAYGFDTMKISYTYLASGVGTFACSIGTGQVMQYAYKRQLRYSPVNIYKARLGYSFYASALQIVSTIIFGWTLEKHVSYFVPVVMTFFVSIGASFFLSASSALLVDLYPGDSAASQSVINLARCLCCAGGLAAVQSMMDTMTIGGTFTFMAGLCFLGILCIWVLMITYGPKKACQKDLYMIGTDSSSDSENE